MVCVRLAQEPEADEAAPAQQAGAAAAPQPGDDAAEAPPAVAVAAGQGEVVGVPPAPAAPAEAPQGMAVDPPPPHAARCRMLPAAACCRTLRPRLVSYGGGQGGSGSGGHQRGSGGGRQGGGGGAAKRHGLEDAPESPRAPDVVPSVMAALPPQPTAEDAMDRLVAQATLHGFATAPAEQVWQQTARAALLCFFVWPQRLHHPGRQLDRYTCAPHLPLNPSQPLSTPQLIPLSTPPNPAADTFISTPLNPSQPRS